ncbi:unnamed protein product, partial [Closterium sp. NIES-53]
RRLRDRGSRRRHYGSSPPYPVEPVEVAVDSGATMSAEPAGAGTGGAEPGVSVSEGVEPGGAASGGAEHGHVVPEGTASGGAEPSRAESGVSNIISYVIDV